MSRELLARHLHWAIEEEDTVSLERWLKESANPNLVLPEGVAAVHLAAGKDTEGGIRCLKLLLQHGANPNVRSTEGLTPLHVAASWGCVKSLKLLLRSGADPTLQDQDRLRAQDLAEEQGNVKCCQILQEYYRDSLPENTEEEPPTYQYVSYRRLSSGFHFFADPVVFGITERHKVDALPGRNDELHPVRRPQRSATLSWSALSVSDPSAIREKPRSYLTEINPRSSRLGDDTSIWSESLRPQSLSGTVKPQGRGHCRGIAEDKGKDHVIATVEVTLDDCMLSNTHVGTDGKFEKLASHEHSSGTDSSEYHTSVGQELTLQDDEGFFPMSAPQPPPALSHGLDTSIDDESFLPPSTSQLCPVGSNRLKSSTNLLPEGEYFLTEPLCAQHKEKQVFKDGNVSINTEWLSELDCTCTLQERPESSQSLSSTVLDLAKHTEFCDSEFLINPSRRKGIDITSPDHIYLFEHRHSTTQNELDKTTAVPLEDTFSHTMGTVGDECPPSANCAQHEGGDSKASISISSRGSSLYCSCESGSECFPSAFGTCERTRSTERVQADTESCLMRETQAGPNQEESVSGCTGDVTAVGIQIVHSRDLQTVPFKDSQFIGRMCKDSRLRRNGECDSWVPPSVGRQCSDCGKGHLDNVTNTSNRDILQSSQAEPVNTSSSNNEEQTTVAQSSLKQSVNLHNENRLDVSLAMSANIQNHKWKQMELLMAEVPADHRGDEEFPGLLTPSTKKSSSSIVSADEPNLGTSHSGSASIDSSMGNKTETSLTEGYSSVGDEKEDGDTALEKLLKGIKFGNETGLSLQFDGNGLSPFVTPRTKSRLANSASRSYNSSLFEQTIVTPRRIRRVRRQQAVCARSPLDTLSHGSAVSQGTEDEDGTCSFAHTWDGEEADFDTVPFVRCNDHEKGTVQPLAPWCSEPGNADFDTVPFPNPNCEKGTDRIPSPMDDAISNKQSTQIKRVMNGGNRNQAAPCPLNLECGGISQDGCVCPPSGQQVVTQPYGRADDVSQGRSSNSPQDNDSSSELRILKQEHRVNGAAELSRAFPRPSSLCPLADDPEDEGSDCSLDGKVCESTRLEDMGLQQGTLGQRCSFSKWPAAQRLSKIPNHDGEWQSPSGDLELQLSPGGRPVNSYEGETVEYLYTDTKEGHTFIERRYPCTDMSAENLSTSGSEDTVIYDWRAYKSGATLCPEEKENEQPTLSPSLLLLSNSQIRRLLKDYGEDPGPVTDFTRKVYLYSLNKIRKEPLPRKPEQSASYSPELCQSLEMFIFPDCSQDELALVQQFEQPDQNRKWREGLLKSSFNYLLLDPRVTKNLPVRCHTLSSLECFRTFVSSIFYVGKGKRSRPYCHLYEALTHFKNNSNQVSAKLKQILDIWENGLGVISLHCFQNVIPVEAYTREACMVDAMGLQMLTNKKRGDYYGVAATWTARRRRLLGVHMLRRALQIFLAEGERQLRPADIRIGQ
ncbi:ankyrin repeat and LEM domain-containing protein 1 isoform X1 [Chiloscyllium plagiosum]|uniref:ankyrin repeat and LEM domain-containing protein 1 isoform X1 n=2 Tax=Chiloscyllium plagiosum TaxID=36176 RepID=UPI001CB850C2|nr:ankyrin repeat and LEM domain-containing protein 1 isoform X1 [Chiloscyllium plagiosum]